VYGSVFFWKIEVSMRRSSGIAAALSLLALTACGEPRPGEEVGFTEDALQVCPGQTTLKGIDVSYYQGTVNWPVVKSAGIKFAIARVNDGGFMDPKFDENWEAIKAMGLARGAYQFFRPGKDASAMADVLISKIGQLGPGDLPPTLDVEATDGESPSSIVAKIHVWVDKVKAATGRTPIIYTGRYFWNDNVGTSEFNHHPLWLAAYTSGCPNTPDAWDSWRMWQHSGSGTVPGISGDVDLNLFNGTEAELAQLASPPNSPPKGALEAADCTSLRGWAQDPDVASDAASVRLYVDGLPGDSGAIVLPILADLDRPDLCQSLGSCEHGFALTLPLGLRDGHEHVVRAYALDSESGSETELSGGPITVACAAPETPLDAIHGIKRWIAGPSVFEAWRFSMLYDLAHEPDEVVAAFPQGPDLPGSPTVVQADDGSSDMWVLDGSFRRRVVDVASLKAWRFVALEKLNAAEVYTYPEGPELRPSPFLVQGTAPDLYVIDEPLDDLGGAGGGTTSTGPGGAGGHGGGTTSTWTGSGGSGDGGDGPATNAAVDVGPGNDAEQDGGCQLAAGGQSRSTGWFVLLLGSGALLLQRRREAVRGGA
jgi:GH25 family lysozyme M1 (1,4-beta-N-acetylmuramidase)